MPSSEVALVEILRRQTEEERRACEGVAIAGDLDPIGAEALSEEPLAATGRQAPEFTPVVLGAVEPTDDGNGGETHASTAKRSVNALHRGLQVVDELQRLREHEAVVPLERKPLRLGQVRYERRL